MINTVKIEDIWQIIYFQLEDYLKQCKEWTKLNISDELHTIKLNGAKLILLPYEFRVTCGVNLQYTISIPYKVSPDWNKEWTAEKIAVRAFEVLIAVSKNELSSSLFV